MMMIMVSISTIASSSSSSGFGLCVWTLLCVCGGQFVYFYILPNKKIHFPNNMNRSSLDDNFQFYFFRFFFLFWTVLLSVASSWCHCVWSSIYSKWSFDDDNDNGDIIIIIDLLIKEWLRIIDEAKKKTFNLCEHFRLIDANTQIP